MTFALITGLISDMVNVLFGLVGADKEGFKALLEEWHLIYSWDSARAMLSVTFVLGLAGALLVERIAGCTRPGITSRPGPG
jgi:hypothetical protein